MCSGTVISSRNVLATATCVDTLSPTDVEVVAGTNMYCNGGFSHLVINILFHPNFTVSTHESNLAILTVHKAFDSTLGLIKPIPLADALPPTNAYVIASAYGVTNKHLDLPEFLQKVNLLVYSRTQCKSYKRNRVTASMFCVGDPNGKKDLCPEDQAAPAVYNSELVGIYSFGCSCGHSASNLTSPVFNSIPSFKNWIQSNIITP